MTERLRRIGPPMLVFIAGTVVYLNALANGFAFDDVFIVQQNSRVHDLTDSGAIWLRPYWPMFGSELGLWRPFVIFFYAVQWAIAGDRAWFFHLISILLHAGVSVLVFLLLRRLTSTLAGAFAGGLLFAVHPVHTEVVANVVGQAELIAAATVLGACLIHDARPDGPEVGWYRRGALVLLFVLGILTKESAIILPALLILVDVGRGRVDLNAAGLRRYATAMAMPLFLMTAAAFAYFSVRVGVLGSIGGVDAAPNLGFLREEHRMLVAFRGWIEYFRLLVFPADLSADYSPGVILPVYGWTPMVALGALILAGTALLALLTPVSPAAGLPAAWLLITMLPTSNLLMPIGVVVAERLLYTPSIALSIAIAFAIRHALHGELPARSKRLATAFGIVILVAMGVRTWIRNPDWKSTEAVLAALSRDHPESYRSQWHNASRAILAGQPEIGEGYMRLAHRIWPHDPELLNELAFMYVGKGQFDSAAAFVERAREITPWLPRTHGILAQAYIGQGRFEEALEAVERAHRLGGPPEITHPLRAQAYEGLGNLELAVAAWDASTRAVPGFWNYWTRHARALARAGFTDRALATTDSALAAAPPGDSAVIAIVTQLRDEIVAGCFGDANLRAAEHECEDRIGQWKLLAPVAVRLEPKNARESQNASAPGSGTALPDSR